MRDERAEWVGVSSGGVGMGKESREEEEEEEERVDSVEFPLECRLRPGGDGNVGPQLDGEHWKSGTELRRSQVTYTLASLLLHAYIYRTLMRPGRGEWSKCSRRVSEPSTTSSLLTYSVL